MPDDIDLDTIADPVELAWWLGRIFERRRIATSQVELGVAWQPVGRLGYERRIARDLADMEAHAVPVRQTSDWPPVTVPGAGGAR